MLEPHWQAPWNVSTYWAMNYLLNNSRMRQLKPLIRALEHVNPETLKRISAIGKLF